MLDYGFSLHQRMLELVSNLNTFDEALNAKQTLVNLETEMHQLSPYGEISDLLRQGWNSMGVDRLRVAISEIIALKQIQASTTEERRNFKWQTALTILFGTLAIPELARSIIKPLWEVSKLPRFQDVNLASLSDIIVAFILVSPFLILAFLNSSRK